MSVLRVTPSGALEVVATSGDARLGGNDFDSALLGWLRKERQARLGTASESSDPQVSRQLAQAAEEAKKRLSVVKTVMVPLGTTLVKAGTTPGTTPGRTPGTAPGTTAGTAGPQAPAEELAVELSRAMRRPLPSSQATAVRGVSVRPADSAGRARPRVRDGAQEARRQEAARGGGVASRGQAALPADGISGGRDCTRGRWHTHGGGERVPRECLLMTL